MFLHSLLALFVVATTLVSGNWRGPYYTHDPLSLWLREQIKRYERGEFHQNVEPEKFVVSLSNKTTNFLQAGAIPNNDSIEVSVHNGKILRQCIITANASGAGTVLIPAHYNFWVLPSSENHGVIDNLDGVTIMLKGNLSAYYQNESAWPTSDGRKKIAFLSIHNSKNIFFLGDGYIWGNGFKWWEEVFTTHTDHRPSALLSIQNVEKFTFIGWNLRDSPQFFVDAHLFGGLIADVDIRVSIFQQYDLHKKYGTFLHEGIDLPLIFPLNTDGLDISGNTVVARDNYVENFDDALCAKPGRMGNTGAEGCTHNILFENSRVTFGVGQTAGSVPPHAITPGDDANTNCIKNVTWRRNVAKYPIKFLYVKPNPKIPNTINQRGLIADLRYEDLIGYNTLWWSVFVSTQQQEQPSVGGADTGCSFLYPLFNSTCPTDPFVPITGLVLENVTSHEPLLSPGILRCNNTDYGPGTGPCTGWQWNNVKMASSVTKFPFGDNFLCHAIDKPVWTDVDTPCKWSFDEETGYHHYHVLEGIVAKISNHETRQNKAEKNTLDEIARRLAVARRSLWVAIMDVHRSHGLY